MYIYNVTTTLDPSIHKEWLQWAKEHYIPSVLAIGSITETRLFRVRVGDESTELTYAVQFTSHDLDTMNQFIEKDAPVYHQLAEQRFPGKLLYFGTVLEMIDSQPQLTGEKLFVYGTLLEAEVQLSVFQRVLDGDTDVLKEYTMDERQIWGRYPTIKHTGNPVDRTLGKLLHLRSGELALADAYEGNGYLRKKIILESQEEAWTYIGREQFLENN